MNFFKEYEKKKISVDEALHLIQSGDNIVTGTGVVAPHTIMENLHKVSEWAKDLTVLQMSSLHDYPFLCNPQYRDVFDNVCVFSRTADRVAYKNHTGAYLPAHLSESAAAWMAVHDVDIFYCMATPMEEDGTFRIGPCLTVEQDALKHAKTVVLEVTEDCPYTYGDTKIRLSDVDYIVETDSKVIRETYDATDEESIRIGQYIAELVNDGDCIQLGIGAIPNAVAKELKSKKHLGIHTEMFINTMVDLMECGAVDNSRKNFHPGKSIACFTSGNDHLFEFLDHNPDVEFYGPRDVIDPRAIAQNDNMVSINTAFGCDMTGQVSSESIGTRQYSGVGGQTATAKGAQWSKGGRSIIAFRSTANLKTGRVSNINPVLREGTFVSLSRNDVDYIITEYGVAKLRGKSVKERILELSNIAHPDYREELRKEAERLYL